MVHFYNFFNSQLIFLETEDDEAEVIQSNFQINIPGSPLLRNLSWNTGLERQMDQIPSVLPPMNSAHSQVMPYSALGPNPTQYTFDHFRPKPCPNIIQQELQRFVF